MASTSHNNTPMTSHSHHRLPWRKDREMEICLRSESSFSADGGRPDHMLIEVTLNFFVKFAVPSAVRGGFHDFGFYIKPSTCYSLPVDNPSRHFSTLDASRESIAPLLTDTDKSPLQGKILGCLGSEISRLAHATLKSAEVQGHTAMKIGANAVCIVREDWNTAVKRANYCRAVQHGTDGGEKESLGTCSVCLHEIRKECILPVTLACSHMFHLGCIAPWLQRQNSCPLCRSKQPIVRLA